SPCSETNLGRPLSTTTPRSSEPSCSATKHMPGTTASTAAARRPRSGSRTSTSISSDEARRRGKEYEDPAMTTLERMRIPSRAANAPLYDWDELVQEDRVHRLIYTDPAVF